MWSFRSSLAKTKPTDLPLHDSTTVAFRDTDGDLMEFKQSRKGLQLFLNGKIATPTWEQLEWLEWDESERKLTDPSNEACTLPLNVNAHSIKELAMNAYPPCEWRGDVPHGPRHTARIARDSEYQEEDECWMSEMDNDDLSNEEFSLLQH